MPEVKWVKDRDELHKGATFANIAYPEEAVPVIPLADLAELVEGLREAREIINDHAPGFTVWLEESEKILVQLEAYRKEGADGQQ